MSKSLQQTIEEGRKLLEEKGPFEINNQGEYRTEMMVGHYGIPGFDLRSKFRTGNSNVTPPKKKRKKRRKTNYLNKK